MLPRLTGPRLRRAVLLAGACIALAAGPAHAQTAPEFQRGFVLTGWKADSYVSPRAGKLLRDMAGGGSDHTAIFTQWFMDAPSSSALAPDQDRTPTDASILDTAAEARAAGLEVTIKPQIGIRTGDWIGNAYPADPSAFWAGYRTMLLHYADLAEHAGAAMLVVGTEMRTLSWDEAHWRPLIAEVREHFHGRLTYAANFDEYWRVPFWDALDYVGIDAYFPLADPGGAAPAAADLAAAWSSRGYLRDIAAVARRARKRVLFTEIGYRGVQDAAVTPNAWEGSGVTDTQAQANAYEAFYEAVAGQPWMAGVYWWEVTPDRWWAQDYDPAGKPAAQVIANWSHRPFPQPTPEPADSQAPAPTTSAAAPAPLRPVVRLRVRGQRVRGQVVPYSSECGGTVSLRLRRPSHGRWVKAPGSGPFAVGADGTFARRTAAGRLLIRAAFDSRCGRARSAWVAAR